VLGDAAMEAIAERGGVAARSAVNVTTPRDLESTEWVD